MNRVLVHIYKLVCRRALYIIYKNKFYKRSTIPNMFLKKLRNFDMKNVTKLNMIFVIEVCLYNRIYVNM